MPTDRFSGLILGTNLTGTDNADGTITIDAGGGGGGGVDSLAKNGDTQLTGDVTLSAGSNVTLTQTGQDIEIAASGGGGGAAAGYGTSLPGSPSDGDEYILVDSTTTPTYQWRFRYNASGATAYDWEFIGGSEKMLYRADDEAVGAATTWALVNGPNFTVPRAGIYVCHSILGRHYSGAAATVYMSVLVNSGSPALYMASDLSAGGPMQGQVQELTCAASDVIRAVYFSSRSDTRINERSLLVRPRKVS